MAVKTKRADAVEPGWLLISGVVQEAEGPVRRARGKAMVETTEMRIRADEIEYNEETGIATAKGNVKFENLERGDVVEADHAEYDVGEESGKFYEVKGTSPSKIQSRPGVLTSTNPFIFQGDWAERLENRYILHQGFITSCKLPKPWWILRGPAFDVIPGDRAIARNAWFRLRGVPLFYTPYFYKSLQKFPRRSGVLTPNIGNSSRRGKMVGGGYYWAINRSNDLTYRLQYFTQRGFAHHIDMRGKPTERSDYNLIVYGVNDRGYDIGNGQTRKEGGFIVTFNGRADLGNGWYARGALNYLSSFAFRQSFTESFFEAIFSEVHSVGFVAKHWSSFGLNLVTVRNENFINLSYDYVDGQSVRHEDKIVIRKLPTVEFNSRDRELKRDWPLWFSMESSAGFLSRTQPEFQTRKFVDRLDIEPRITAALRWKDFSLVPSFAIRETTYDSSRQVANGSTLINGSNILRSAREADVAVVLPSLARIFEKPPKWMGQKVKHVIEPKASFHYTGGVTDFERYIHFDEADLLANTAELTVGLVNRLYTKRKDGQVYELLSWQLWQKRFFEPTFGGAVVPFQRNVVLSTAEFTDYAFLDIARRYSPVVSILRMQPDPRIGIEWRSDFDPLRNQIVNSGFTADGHFSKFFVSVGHDQVRYAALAGYPPQYLDPNHPVLAPNSNQFRGLLGIGQENRHGWNAAFSANYDYRVGVLRYATTQVTYNSDCCGFSVQYRRFDFGTRNENQFRVAFVIANVGSFGTLKKQERIF